MPKKNEHIFFNNLPDFEKEAEEEVRRRNMPKAPSFSLEDMEQARKDAFEKGREEGLQIAKDAIEQRTEILIHSLIDRIHDLEMAEDTRHAMAIDNSVSITYKAIEKLIPALLDKNKTALILHALDDFFRNHTNKHELTLFVHSSIQQAVEKHIQNLSKNIVIQTDNTMTDAQARMEWTNGSFEFKPDEMIAKILKIIEKHTDEPSESLDESAKTTHNDEIDVSIEDIKHE